MDQKLLLCGLGGQGVVFLSRLLARAALAQGLPVAASETHGMSRRGGAVQLHLRLGSRESPLIRRGTADLLLALDAHEAVRNLPWLRRGGTAFVNTAERLPSELAEPFAQLGIAVHRVAADRLAAELGRHQAANVVLAGFAAAHSALPLAVAALRDAVAAMAPRGAELNRQAVEAGYLAGGGT